jgi:hypothetical protein
MQAIPIKCAGIAHIKHIKKEAIKFKGKYMDRNFNKSNYCKCVQHNLHRKPSITYNM